MSARSDSKHWDRDRGYSSRSRTRDDPPGRPYDRNSSRRSSTGSSSRSREPPEPPASHSHNTRHSKRSSDRESPQDHPQKKTKTSAAEGPPPRAHPTGQESGSSGKDSSEQGNSVDPKNIPLPASQPDSGDSGSSPPTGVLPDFPVPLPPPLPPPTPPPTTLQAPPSSSSSSPPGPSSSSPPVPPVHPSTASPLPPPPGPPVPSQLESPPLSSSSRPSLAPDPSNSANPTSDRNSAATTTAASSQLGSPSIPPPEAPPDPQSSTSGVSGEVVSSASCASRPPAVSSETGESVSQQQPPVLPAVPLPPPPPKLSTDRSRPTAASKPGRTATQSHRVSRKGAPKKTSEASIPPAEDSGPPSAAEGHERQIADIVNHPTPIQLPHRNGYRYLEVCSLLDDAKAGEWDPLRCVGCGVIVRTEELWGCQHRHTSCLGCRRCRGACAVCKSPHLNNRLESYEQKRAERLADPSSTWPCRNRASGCTEFHPSDDILWHEATCGVRKTVCPNSECTWRGNLVAFPEHCAATFCADLLPIYEHADSWIGYIRDNPRATVLQSIHPFTWTQVFLVSEKYADLNLVGHFYLDHSNKASQFYVSADVPASALRAKSISVRMTLFSAESKLRPWALSAGAQLNRMLQHSAPGIRPDLIVPPPTVNPTIPLRLDDYKARIARGRQNESKYIWSWEQANAVDPEAGPNPEAYRTSVPAYQVHRDARQPVDQVRAAEALMTMSANSGRTDASSSAHPPAGPSSGRKKKTATRQATAINEDSITHANSLPTSTGNNFLLHLLSSNLVTHSASGRPSSRVSQNDPEGARVTLTGQDLANMKKGDILFYYVVQVIRGARPV